MKREVKTVLGQINRKSMNNTQRVLMQLLNAEGEWVSRTSIRVPSVGSRLRDLRKAEFGSFDIRCATAQELSKRANVRATFYSIEPRTVTGTSVRQAFRTAMTEV